MALIMASMFAFRPKPVNCAKGYGTHCTQPKACRSPDSGAVSSRPTAATKAPSLVPAFFSRRPGMTQVAWRIATSSYCSLLTAFPACFCYLRYFFLSFQNIKACSCSRRCHHACITHGFLLPGEQPGIAAILHHATRALPPAGRAKSAMLRIRQWARLWSRGIRDCPLQQKRWHFKV